MAERGIYVIRVWNREVDEENLKRLIAKFAGMRQEGGDSLR